MNQIAESVKWLKEWKKLGANRSIAVILCPRDCNDRVSFSNDKLVSEYWSSKSIIGSPCASFVLLSNSAQVAMLVVSTNGQIILLSRTNLAPVQGITAHLFTKNDSELVWKPELCDKNSMPKQLMSFGSLRTVNQNSRKSIDPFCNIDPDLKPAKDKHYYGSF